MAITSMNDPEYQQKPKNCRLTIDNREFIFDLQGKFSHGNDEVLFDPGGLLEHVSWQQEGFTILDLLSPTETNRLITNLSKILNQILTEENLGSLNALEKYHEVIDSDEKHQKVISRTRFLTSRDFEIDLNEISRRVSHELDKEVGIDNPLLEEEIIILRISRPESMDINPLHRDGYLDIWANTINVWIPVAGCNKWSSLPLIPGSHWWNEQDVVRTPPRNAVINGNTYHVPGIIGGPEPLHAIRPDPAAGQALLFTPFLVHGAAINQNSDLTRMSLEFRLCAQ